MPVKPPLQPNPASKRQAKIRATEGGFPVLRLFKTAIPTEVFRVVAVETDLDGLAPVRLPAGALVVFELGNATTSENRFLTCCGQRTVVELVLAVVNAYDPTLPVLPVAQKDQLITYA